MLSLHAALADGTVDQAAEDIGLAGMPDLVFATAAAAPLDEQVLGLAEGLIVDRRLVRELL